MNDLISLILPAFNAQNYIGRCIESLLKQTYRNLEIIIINDGSIDRTLEICKEYEKKDSRIILINQENKGVSYCRNNGIARATGDFIVFIDSDDYIDASMVEKLHEVQKEKDADIVQCGYYIIYDGGKISKSITQSYVEGSKEDIMNFYIHNLELCVVPWNKLIRKKVMEEIEFPLNRRYEDEATTYKIFYNAEVVVNLDCALYYYYQNKSGFMNAEELSIKKLSDLIKAKEEMSLFIVEKCKSLREEAINDFLWTLFINSIKALKCALNNLEDEREYKWIRKKLVEYYDKIKKHKDIKKSTLFILRYFPFILKIKKIC